jgi:hypothetical protein
MIPNPPALETALANSHPEHQIIPAWITGYFILKSSVILFMCSYSLKEIRKYKESRKTLSKMAETIQHILTYATNQHISLSEKLLN